MRPIDKVCDRLEHVRQSGPNSYRAACPAHGRGVKGSLAVRELEDGRLLLHCFAGCEVADIVAALGLGFEDLFPERTNAGFARREYFNARDVLAGIQPELMIVVATLRAWRNRETLSNEALARFDLAVARLARAGRLADV